MEDPLYPPTQKITGLPVDECANDFPIGVEGMGYATVRCRTEAEVDNRVVAKGPSTWLRTGEDV